MANWAKRLKKNVRLALTGKAGYSKAGKDQLKYAKAVKRFAKDIKKDNPGLSDKQATEVAEDELSGAREKREKRKKRERRPTNIV